MVKSIKYWVRPDLENRIINKEVTSYFETVVEEILSDRILVRQRSKTFEIPAQQVFALTGYHPSTRFFDQLGVEFNTEILEPQYDPESHETNVPGVFVAGSVVAGRRMTEVFIENGRFHGQIVMDTIAARINKPR